jgi:hypothetical protein
MRRRRRGSIRCSMLNRCLAVMVTRDEAIAGLASEGHTMPKIEL